MLKFSLANAKTKRLYRVRALRKYLKNNRKVYSLDLLSGYSCPGAKHCLSRAVVGVNGKRHVLDGKHCQYRCFSASQEAFYTNLYNLRKHNLESLRKYSTPGPMFSLIIKSIPKNAGIVRLHVGGEIFNRSYLSALMRIACHRTDLLFYAYTKSLHLLKRVDFIDSANGILLPNFLITASLGGKYDSLVEKLKLRYSRVIFSKSEANGLPIDHNDSHAATTGSSFCTLLHGIQPAGSQSLVALRKLNGKGSYGRKSK